MKVLIIDDNECIRELLAEYLNPFAVCDLASNAHKAFEMIKDSLSKNEPYDLIFSDFIMPNISGVDLLNKIRSFEKNYSFKHKFILVTSQPKASLKNIIDSDLSFDDYITKPFDLGELYKKITKLGFELKN